MVSAGKIKRKIFAKTSFVIVDRATEELIGQFEVDPVTYLIRQEGDPVTVFDVWPFGVLFLWPWW